MAVAALLQEGVTNEMMMMMMMVMMMMVMVRTKISTMTVISVICIYTATCLKALPIQSSLSRHILERLRPGRSRNVQRAFSMLY